MNVGLYFDLRNPPRWRRPPAAQYARALEICEEADRLGASSVWLSEHHFFEDGYLPQPLTFAAAVAARTARLRIGTAVYLAALRPPVQIAEETAIVDLVSNGRFDLGVGVGYRVPEYSAFGADIAQRYPLLETTIREVRRLWEEGGVTPAPVQNPLPLWGGFFGPRGAELAGRLGMGLLALVPGIFDAYVTGLRSGGHEAEQAVIRAPVEIVLSEDPERAWERIRPHLAYKWDSYLTYAVEGTGRPPPRPIDPERWRRPGPRGEYPRFQVLTVDEAAAFLVSACEGLPVEEVFCPVSQAGMPDDLVEEHLALLLGKLRPRLDEQGPARATQPRVSG